MNAWKWVGRTLSVAALAVAMTAGFAVPAQAGDSGTVYTDDGTWPGGSLNWDHSGDWVTVCDREADGRYAWGKAWYQDTGGTWRVIGYAVQIGGKGNCAYYDFEAPENRPVKIRACLRETWDSPLIYCDTEFGLES